jgi:hypothetical protein
MKRPDGKTLSTFPSLISFIIQLPLLFGGTQDPENFDEEVKSLVSAW